MTIQIKYEHMQSQNTLVLHCSHYIGYLTTKTVLDYLTYYINGLHKRSIFVYPTRVNRICACANKWFGSSVEYCPGRQQQEHSNQRTALTRNGATSQQLFQLSNYICVDHANQWGCANLYSHGCATV